MDLRATKTAGEVFEQREASDRSFRRGLTVLFGVAFVFLVFNEQGFWAADARFELYENPNQRLRRMLSMWDSSRGLGRERGDFWPGFTLFVAFFRGLGFPTWVVQRLWHGSLICLGGGGVAMFLREIRRGGLATQLAAAALYMFGPYSVAFLLPSNLYLNYAVAPWIWLVFYRGVHARSWRSVAQLGLIVLLIGNTEAAGTAYAFLYLVPVAVFAVHIERTVTWREVVGWALRFAVVFAGIIASVLVVVLISSEVFAQNLRETESSRALNSNSSWAETWRGLGSWLLYFQNSFGLARPATQAYLTSTITVLGTFGIPICALYGLTRKRREMPLLGMMMLMGMMMMVGLFPNQDSSIYGRIVGWLYGAVPSTEFLRNNFKAGSGAMFGIAGLFGLTTEAVLKNLRSIDLHSSAQRRITSSLSVVGLGAVLVLASTPFWATTLYNADTTYDELPGYVYEAADWLDAQPEDGRAFFLPRAYRNGFRWGFVNDDYLDALIERPHVVEVPIHLSRETAANLVASLDRALPDGAFTEGSVEAFTELLGADFVVIRNDIDWQTWRQPRPSQFQSVRQDPALELVATFGEPGENTVAASDRSPQVLLERQLPPIEIYRVTSRAAGAVSAGPSRIEPATPPLLVAGDADAFPVLAESGLLETGRTVAYAGAQTSEQLVENLNDGSPVFITDTNRRRSEVITNATDRSHTLADGEEFRREVFQLFPHDDTQSVADFNDGAVIRSAGPALGDSRVVWHRPSMAFDRDAATSWQTPPLTNPLGQTLRVDLHEPSDVRGIRIAANRRQEVNGKRLTEATVVLSDNTTIVADLEDGFFSIDFTPREISWAELVVTDVGGEGLATVGVDEFEIVGLNLQERILTPTRFTRLDETDPEISEALDQAQIGYGFERSVGEGAFPEERTMNRLFDTYNDNPLSVGGRMKLTLGASDADLVGFQDDTAVTAVASSRFTGRLDFRGEAAVDGDPLTGWVVEAIGAPTLELGFEPQRLQTLEISAVVGEGLSTPTSFEVRAGDDDEFVATFPFGRSSCSEPQCEIRGSAFLPNVLAEELTITILGFNRERGNPLRVAEVVLNGQANQARTPLSTACVDGLLNIDGQGIAVRVPDPAELFTGGSVRFESCEPVRLAPGRHVLSGSDSAQFDMVVALPSEILAATSPSQAEIALLEKGGSSSTYRVSNPDEGAVFVLGESFHPGWKATIDGDDLGPPLERDAVAAWLLPAGEDLELQIRFGPHRWFQFAFALTVLTTLACFALIIINPRWKAPDTVATRTEGRDRSVRTGVESRRAVAVLFVIPIIFGALAAGLTGALLGFAGALILRGSEGDGRHIVSFGALALLILAAVATVTESSLVVGLGFAAERPVADAASKFAAILASVVVAAALIEGRHPSFDFRRRKAISRSDERAARTGSPQT